MIREKKQERKEISIPKTTELNWNFQTSLSESVKKYSSLGAG